MICLLSMISMFSQADEGLPRAEALFTETPPQVDGIEQRGEWTKAKPVTFPEEQTDTEPCQVRVLWAVEGLYVLFQTQETTPVVGHFQSGEPLYQEDTFEIFLDPEGDHRQFVEIQINPAGQVYLKNHVLTALPRLMDTGRLTQEFVESDLWRYEIRVPDGFRVASRVDPQTHQWTLEVFLPAAFVERRSADKVMKPRVARMNLVRHDWKDAPSVPGRQPAFCYWAPVLPGHPHLSPTLMGYLELKKEKPADP